MWLVRCTSLFLVLIFGLSICFLHWILYLSRCDEWTYLFVNGTDGIKYETLQIAKRLGKIAVLFTRSERKTYANFFRQFRLRKRENVMFFWVVKLTHNACSNTWLPVHLLELDFAMTTKQSTISNIGADSFMMNRLRDTITSRLRHCDVTGTCLIRLVF